MDTPPDIKGSWTAVSVIGGLLASVATFSGLFATTRRKTQENAEGLKALQSSCVSKEVLRAEIKVLELKLVAYNRLLLVQVKQQKQIINAIKQLEGPK